MMILLLPLADLRIVKAMRALVHPPCLHLLIGMMTTRYHPLLHEQGQRPALLNLYDHLLLLVSLLSPLHPHSLLMVATFPTPRQCKGGANQDKRWLPVILPAV